MNIHQKINVKGNLQKWLGPKSFLKSVKMALQRDYAGEFYIGTRLFYKQDRKTNEREPREPYYEGNGQFASNH